MSKMAAGVIAALLLSGGAFAQDAAPAPQPAPPGGTGCAPALVPPEAACQVAGAAVLERGLVWAFYDLGEGALSVLLAPSAGGMEPVASMPVSGGAVQLWRDVAYDPAAVFEADGQAYAGMAVRGEEGAIEALAVYRIEGESLVAADTAGLTAALRAKLAALAPGCEPVTGGMDWRRFSVRHSVMGEAGSCGTVMMDLGISDGRVEIVDSLALRPAQPHPSSSRRASRRAR